MALEKKIEWKASVSEKYNNMLVKIPIFHREITKQVVEKKAILNAQERGCETVGEADVIRAFLSEVPKAFYSMMIRLMDNVGFDHKKYETE